jgi:murein DD-endopeptidase MepM/ murein hydrolase activator NlpD
MNIVRQFGKAAGLSAAAFFAMAASPALANGASAATQATGVIDIAKTSDAPLIRNDEEFSRLFASWQADADEKTGIAGVSVPSRMPLENMVLTSSYGMRNHPVLGKRRKHNGVDLAAPRGTPVYATADGKIEMAQRYSSYGNYVQIAHGGEYETRYAHLSSYTVAEGDMVHKGELIGYVGSTGRSTGPHLHYEVRLEGAPVDPRPYMSGTQLAIRENANAQGGPEEE